MREWIWRYRAVVFPVAAVSAATAALLFYRANGTPWPMAVLFTLFNAVWFFGLPYLYLRRDRNRRAALKEQGSIVHLRYPGSRPGSLPDRWAEGTAGFRPGKIRFQEMMSGTDVAQGLPIELDILDCTGPARSVTRGEAHQLPPGLEVLTLAIRHGTVKHGTVQIAAEPPVLAQLQHQVLQNRPAG